MTTMNDMQVLGELGWASQVIYDQTVRNLPPKSLHLPQFLQPFGVVLQGLVPAFWRPPYGDVECVTLLSSLKDVELN